VNSEIRIRRFSLSDLDRVMEIEHLSFGADAFSRSTFKSSHRNSDSLFIVAEISSVIVGYMITFIFHETGHIVSIAVDPAYRRKGVGKNMVEFTHSRLNELRVKSMELEVRITNINGIRFWQCLSFFASGIYPRYYMDGTDALRMRKSLTDHQ
jgi:ribosomal-protein-alanine N-acetyltransferase